MAEEKLTYEEWRDKEIAYREELCKDWSEIDRWHRIHNFVAYLEIRGLGLYQEYLADDGVENPMKIARMDDEFLTNNKAVNR